MIGPEVVLGARVTVKSHAVITGWTELGDDCMVWPFATVGEVPQVLKFKGERTRLIIGARCTHDQVARSANVARLAGLDANELARSGTQEGVGRVSLGDIPGKMQEHDEAHRAEILALRERLDEGLP